MAAPLRVVSGLQCTRFTNTTVISLGSLLTTRRNFSFSSVCNEKNMFKHDFRTFDLRKVPERFRKRKFIQVHVPPRFRRMRTDQDWTAVWPTAKTFNWSVVPLPIRQGAAEGAEGRNSIDEYSLPPPKESNTELLKIPNFLHLTPKHIKQHCEAIKKFCTRWPDELDTSEMSSKFPIEVITSDYCFSGPSVRDARARIVTVKYQMSSLELDYHARDKMIRLLGNRYDAKTDTITIVADRCPLKQQNYEYIQYLLTALYFESWKVEEWESEKTEADMERYFWDISASKKNIVQLLNVYKEKIQNLGETEKAAFTHLPDTITPDTVSKVEEVISYKSAVEDLHVTGENIQTLNSYKQSVLDMLKIQQQSSSSGKS